MAHPLATRMANLLNLNGGSSQPLAADSARITLATLNQARKTLPHPATPAYRVRKLVRRAPGRPAWTFPVDTGGSPAPASGAAPEAPGHRR